MGNLLFTYRGWFLFLCFAIVFTFRLFSNNSLDYSGIWLILAGWMIRLAAGFYILDHTNSENLSCKELATTGVYSLTRNPMYLGNILACEGVLIFSNCLPGFAHLLVITAIFLYYQILIRTEEKYLSGKFGQEYCEYMKVTPRWISSKTFSKSHNWKPVSSLSAVVKVQLPNVAKTVLAVSILLLTK